MTHPTERLWRTMIYFDSVHIGEGTARVRLPGWDSEIMVELSLQGLPEDVLSAAVPGYRCYAKVNIGAEEEKDLVFQEWEASSHPCPDCRTVLFSGEDVGWHCLCNNFAVKSLPLWESHVEGTNARRK